MQPIEIKELIEKVKQKDEAAFRQLVLWYQNKVYAFTFRMLCSEEDANDASQEIFIKVWKSIQRYKPDFSFNTWLYRIATNHCNDVLRKRKRIPEMITDMDGAEALKYIAQPDIESNISNKHLAAIIRGLTQKLPDKQKVVFVLKELEDLNVDEISAITKLSPKKIKSNLYVARNTMRKLLNETFQNEQD